MSRVTFTSLDAAVEVEPGTTILEASQKAGIPLEAPCGGYGTCGRCKVKVVSGDVDAADTGKLSEELREQGYVLACRTKVTSHDVEIAIPALGERDAGDITVEGLPEEATESVLPGDVSPSPLAAKQTVTVPPPEPEDGLSDLDRLAAVFGRSNCIPTMTVLRALPAVLREQDGLATLTYVDNNEYARLFAVEPGDTAEHSYGIAVDVGTTTVAVELIHLPDARTVEVCSGVNRQSACGADVISRINYARRGTGLEDLRRQILDTINELTATAAEQAGIRTSDIIAAVIAGNTTMMHLLYGIPPEYLRREPYVPAVKVPPLTSAGDLGLHIAAGAPVYTVPAVASYVGGDIISGLACTDLPDGDEISLFIDVGTNGEMVLGNSDFMLCCACSAGPAFEGGGVRHGMRAVQGTIDRVSVDKETGAPEWHTIGDKPPRGICGSGMIAVLSSLFETGWLDQRGRLSRDRTSANIISDDRNASYVIVPAEESATGENIVIDERDIESILRAKAAVYSACELMLEQVGLSAGDISRVYIAGGFGRVLDIGKSITLGLFPDIPRERYSYIGNASLNGAALALVSEDYRRLQRDLAKRITNIELSTDPSYMNQYTGAMFLPHTDIGRFPTVKERLFG